MPVAEAIVLWEPIGESPVRSGSPKEVTFSDFVFLQCQQAGLSLGETPNTATGKYEVSFPIAQCSIEVPAMLKRKAEGNLTPEEERLLEAVPVASRLRGHLKSPAFGISSWKHQRYANHDRSVNHT